MRFLVRSLCKGEFPTIWPKRESLHNLNSEKIDSCLLQVTPQTPKQQAEQLINKVLRDANACRLDYANSFESIDRFPTVPFKGGFLPLFSSIILPYCMAKRGSYSSW